MQQVHNLGSTPREVRAKAMKFIIHESKTNIEYTKFSFPKNSEDLRYQNQDIILQKLSQPPFWLSWIQQG